jgi:hypothetical protein
MNYWESQKSFWKTTAGRVLHLALLLAILGGGLLALNFFITPYPVIESFHVTPVVILPGQSANLSWSVVGASEIKIDPAIGQVEPKGFRMVSPAETVVYTLWAVNGSRNRSAEARLMVDG